MIHKHRFAAQSILRVAVANEGKLGVHFLNWRVSSRPLGERNVAPVSFNGCGLYGVCFRGRLIYVGSYCGRKPAGIKKGAYFAGDVVSNRWWQHFGSLTARSRKLHVGQRILVRLCEDLEQHPMLLALSQAGPILHKDDGCLGAENRLRFAARHWARFSDASASRLLQQFAFVYARDDGRLLNGSPSELAQAIEGAETEAIRAMQPEVNTAKRIPGAAARRISTRVALQELASTLDRHLRPYRSSAITA